MEEHCSSPVPRLLHSQMERLSNICTFERAALFLFHRSLGCGATVLVVQRKIGMAATTPNLMDAMTEDENDESRALRCPGTDTI